MGQEPGKARAQAGRYVALDGLRGIAALAVALLHLEPALSPGGYLAVDFFFALSGFVLMRGYGARFRSGMTTLAFMKARIVRLYPLFAVGIVVGLLFALQGLIRQSDNHLSLAAITAALALNLLMLPAFGSALYPLNYPAWSLLMELLANIALAAVLWRLGRVALLAVAVVSAGLLAWLGQAAGSLDGGGEWVQFPIALTRTAWAFSIGTVLATRASSEVRPVSIGALAGFAFLAAVVLFPATGIRSIYDLAAALVGLPALVWFGSRLEPPHWCVGPAAFLGEVSYAVYAINMPMAHVFQYLGRHLGEPLIVLAPVYIATVLGLARGLVTFIDIPVRRMLRRWVECAPCQTLREGAA